MGFMLQYNMIQNISDVQFLSEVVSMEAVGSPLSKIYTHIRNLKEYDLIGDYLILAHILEVCGIKRWKRNQMLNACRKTELEPDRKQAYIPKQWEKFIY
jgi:hypothetical protein